MVEAIRWPEDMTPSRSPIHLTNEIDVEVSPETIWSFLTDPQTSRFETNLAGQDVLARVLEFEPMTRIAWGGGPKASNDSRAYHAWIMAPTPPGNHPWTEETMQARSGSNSPSRRPFWRTHDDLLEDLSRVAVDREGT